MGYYITYSAIDQFIAGTVHSAIAHNSPHTQLLANDTALDTKLKSVDTSVVTLQSQIAALGGTIRSVFSDYIEGPITLADGGSGASATYSVKTFSISKISGTSKIFHIVSLDSFGGTDESGKPYNSQTYNLYSSSAGSDSTTRKVIRGANPYYTRTPVTLINIVSGMPSGINTVGVYGSYDSAANMRLAGTANRIQQFVFEFEII
jgi:hypothetical protein